MNLVNFLTESLRIEGIFREPSYSEVAATNRFFELPLTAENVILLQSVYVPDKPLREQVGMNVRVGQYIAPSGGPHMMQALEDVLREEDPYEIHVAFEVLHPFLDGNGRVGRSVWAHRMFERGLDPFRLPFLQWFYYETLKAAGK